jgi:hypothetical protein
MRDAAPYRAAAVAKSAFGMPIHDPYLLRYRFLTYCKFATLFRPPHKKGFNIMAGNADIVTVARHGRTTLFAHR